MKHNLILCWICVFLEMLLLVIGWITGNVELTPLMIMLVAALYFAGRQMDKLHGN